MKTTAVATVLVLALTGGAHGSTNSVAQMLINPDVRPMARIRYAAGLDTLWTQLNRCIRSRDWSGFLSHSTEALRQNAPADTNELPEFFAGLAPLAESHSNCVMSVESGTRGTRFTVSPRAADGSPSPDALFCLEVIQTNREWLLQGVTVIKRKDSNQASEDIGAGAPNPQR